MAKTFDQPIDISTNWNGDESTGGMPVSGRRVREFLQEFLQELANSKIGCYRLQTNDDGTATLRGFSSEASAEAWAAAPEAMASLVLSQVSFYSQPVQDDYTLTARITQNLDATMVKGSSNVLKFTYNSFYGGDSTDLDTEPGYARFYINNTHMAELDMTLQPGGTEYSIDLGAFLTQETNAVKIEIGNRHGKSRTWTLTIRSLEIVLALDNSYDESVLRDSAWAMRVRCSGTTAQVHLKIDGTEVAQTTITNSTYDFPIDTSGTLSPGAHTVEIWAENANYDIRTETITTSFIKRGLGIPSVCIGGAADKTVTLYGTAVIPYFLYYPGATAGTEVQVNFEVRDTSNTLLDTPSPQTLTLSADGTSGMQEWRLIVGDNNYLALGQINLIVKVGNATATHRLAVTDAGVTLEEASECKVHLSAAGRTNADVGAEQWTSTYGNETTCVVRRSPNFKLVGENGFGNDRYLIKAGKSITLEQSIDKRPFGYDFGANSEDVAKRTGRTFAFEFKTVNCTNSDALIISCMDGGIGFEIYANRAVLYSTAGKIETRYGDEEKISIGFCIDGTTTHCVNRLIDGTTESDANIAYMYVNGVIVRIMNYASAEWKQPNPNNIVIGSPDCDIELYTVRLYDKSLNYQQMTGNFAFDTPALSDKIAIAVRNNILNSNGEVDFAKVLAALPTTPYAIWEMPRMPTGKKDWVKTNTEFVNPRWVESMGKAMASFVCTQHDQALDGTSSLSYPEPYKNWASKYNGQWKARLGDVEVVITSYSITEGIEDGEKEFVHKVNFASSEGIGNILAMNAYQQILLGTAERYPNLLTPPQAERQAQGLPVIYRHSLSGFPEIGFLRTYENGTPVVRFLSIFNLISNKYSPSIFGFDNSGTAEAWEVEDNVNFFMEELQPGTYTNNKWNCRATELYYARFPKTSPTSGADYGKASSASGVTQANNENAHLRTFHNWLVSCNPNVAERYRLTNGSYRSLSRSVTYGDTTYTQDTPAYRYAKFANEYAAQGLVKESALFYLNFCDYNINGDSFDKNMTLLYVNGKWYILLRDTDTGWLYGNRGTLLYKVFHEWNDSYDESTDTTGVITGETYNPDTQTFTVATTAGSPVYNGRLSGLWDCSANVWAEDRKTMYLAMRSAGLNAADMMAIYNSFWAQWSEALYNNDAMGYANTGRFDMAHGDKREVFKYFYKYRQRYMDSKFNANTSQALELRLWGNGNGVALRHYCPIYAALNWGAGGIQTARSIKPGEAAYFPSTGTTFNETTFTVYDADLLTEISTYIEMPNGDKEESGLQNIATSIDITGLAFCKRLKSLVLDYSDKTPNTNLSNRVLEVGNSKALKHLIVRNCPNVTGSLDLQSEQIIDVDFRGTPISGLTIPQTDSLTSVQLGSGMKNLRLSDFANLSTLTMDGVGQLTTLEISNCPQLDTRVLLEDILAAEDCILARVKLHGINWSNFSLNYLERLTDMGADMTGTIAINPTAIVTFDLKKKLVEIWGDIDDESNPMHITYTQRGLTGVTITGKSYISEAGTYQIGLTPSTKNANDFKAIEWSIASNRYATINPLTGELTVTSVGTEDNAPKAKITVKVTLIDGTVLTDEKTIGFYERSCKVGDYVYADGSYSDILDGDKTPVGVCFYINPNDKTQRLCMALRDMTSYPWGLYSGDNTNGIQGIALADSPQYNVYDVPTLSNIGSRGINGNYVNESSYRDETTSGDSDGFMVLDKSTAVGEIGFAAITTRLGRYEAGTVLPYGLINTLKIIEHRNIILGDSAINLPIPTTVGGQTLYQNLMQCITDVIANNDNNAKYRQFYYPAASVCNAYEPGVKVGETLADCFKAGRWFLPSEGELARMYWYHRQGYDPTNPLAVFAQAKADGQLAQPSNSWYWSSTEGSQVYAWSVGFSDGYTLSIYKYYTYAVRAVAAF